MSKREKIWLFSMIFLAIINIVLHFIGFNQTAVGQHLNYIASIFSTFTVGVMVADTPRLKG